MSGYQKTQQKARPQKSDRAAKPEKQAGQKIDPQQMLEAPETMRSEDVLAAQQTLGNQVVQRALDKDPKREASTDEGGNLLPELSDAINQARGSGTPLPNELQSEAKKSLGGSFKDVRLHTDEQADQISRRISARAFTIGKDIFFKKGAYAPGSSQGRETLIHELTHVVQQSGGKGSSGPLKLGEPGNAMEQQADKLGKKAAQGVSKSSPAQVQRMPVEEEELQMQSEEEEELLQMQSEEEELQMQSMEMEEEELQMQPDAAVVQRKWVQDGDEWKKEEDKTAAAPKRGVLNLLNASVGAQQMLGNEGTIEKGGKKVAANPWKEAGLSDEEQGEVASTSRKKYETNTDLLKETNGGGAGAKEKKQSDRMKAIEGVEADRATAFSNDMNTNYSSEKEQQKGKKAEEKEKFEKTIPGQRIKLVNMLKDPNTKPAELKQVEDKLIKLHKANPQLIKDAKAERSSKLKEAAARGDDKAYDQMQSEEAAEETAAKAEKEKNPSTGKKIGGFMKKAGLGLAKGIGGVLASQGKDGLKHFLGVDPDKDDDEDDEKEEKKGSKGGKASGSGGGGGSGIGTIMEKYAEVVEENKKLKAQLEKKDA
jgi:hypothetical protein